MKKSTFSTILAVILSLLSLSTALAHTPSITNGLAYLTANRNSDTSWGDNSSTIDPATATAAVLETL